MKAAIKGSFAAIAAILFFLGGATILWGTYRTPGFSPNSGQVFLLEMMGGGIVAFITAQLGLAVATSGNGLLARIRSTMGFAAGDKLLILDVIVFLVIAFGFVLLWVKPDLIAVPEGSQQFKEAPEYIATQAKLYLGVVLAALTALGSSV